MQTVSVDENLLRQVMRVTGLTQTEALEESLRITLNLYTKTPNKMTRDTFRATDAGKQLTRFGTLNEMLKALKEGK